MPTGSPCAPRSSSSQFPPVSGRLFLKLAQWLQAAERELPPTGRKHLSPRSPPGGQTPEGEAPAGGCLSEGWREGVSARSRSLEGIADP